MFFGMPWHGDHSFWRRLLCTKPLTLDRRVLKNSVFSTCLDSTKGFKSVDETAAGHLRSNRLLESIKLLVAFVRRPYGEKAGRARKEGVKSVLFIRTDQAPHDLRKFTTQTPRSSRCFRNNPEITVVFGLVDTLQLRNVN